MIVEVVEPGSKRAEPNRQAGLVQIVILVKFC